MITFYLVRHGNKEAIPFDPPLTKVGVKQAAVTAQYLKQISFKAIITSPKLRTVQTAQAIASPLALEVITDERLTERMEWENKESFDEFIAEWSKTDNDRNFQPKTGASSTAKGVIMKKVVDELTSKHKDGNVLIVTHGGSIGDLLRHIFETDTIPHVVDPVTNAPHILISECSITVIKNNDNEFTLTKLNNTSHLLDPSV